MAKAANPGNQASFSETEDEASSPVITTLFALHIKRSLGSSNLGPEPPRGTVKKLISQVHKLSFQSKINEKLIKLYAFVAYFFAGAARRFPGTDDDLIGPKKGCSGDTIDSL